VILVQVAAAFKKIVAVHAPGVIRIGAGLFNLGIAAAWGRFDERLFAIAYSGYWRGSNKTKISDVGAKN